jgi:hypothetical protein
MDLDFYQTLFDTDVFDRAEAAVLTALREAGYDGIVGHSDSWLRQIIVTDPATSEQVALDLGQDYRRHPPVLVANLGPVIDPADAATSKARALNDRRAARDYLDLHALLSSGTWTPASLYAALRDHLRPTLTVEQFAADLAAAGDQDPEDYTAYGLDAKDIARLAAAFNEWAKQLRDDHPTTRPAAPSSQTPARRPPATTDPFADPFNRRSNGKTPGSPRLGL